MVMKWYRVIDSISEDHVRIFAIPEQNYGYYPSDEYTIGGICEPNLFDILREIESDLESGNYHSMIGVAKELSRIIAEHTKDMYLTTKIMRDIYESNLFMR